MLNYSTAVYVSTVCQCVFDIQNLIIYKLSIKSNDFVHSSQKNGFQLYDATPTSSILFNF